MDSSTSVAPPPFSIGSLAKAITKFFSLHRATTGSGDGEDDDALYKIKLSENHGHHSRVLPQALSPRCERRKETEILVANIFAVVSAIKAAYAQLQLAQSPYNPDAVQSADRVIITELKRLSELKQSFSSNHLAATSPLAAQVEEQRNLLMTYKIIIAKLEAEIKSKDSEVASLQSDLKVAEKRCRTLDARLRPGRTLSSLDDLHLSGLNPAHFLTLLRSATKSIRSFVKVMTQEMESAGWDIDAAAAAIQPDICFRRRRSSSLALESYVSYLLFSDFGNPDFGLGGPLKDRLQCFAEFTELKFVKAKECFARNPQFEKFCRGKYLEMVHHKMEVSIFGDLDQRTLVSYGRGWPETKFFEGLRK
ncbi:hypothetical protein HPP92_000572 [Vanilla planifolia]|uniref:DUF641 domain-containing protein n=1 Tax=Vanilla planifolia TaxID=51239 RepID=A0A835VGR2_VANPL|nr:hypothetical protein HPP92_000572 [Vanilla planifolia]